MSPELRPLWFKVPNSPVLLYDLTPLDLRQLCAVLHQAYFTNWQPLPGVSPHAPRTHPRGLRFWSFPARRVLGRLLEDEVRDPLWRAQAGYSWSLPLDPVAHDQINPLSPAYATNETVTDQPEPKAPIDLVADLSDDEDRVLIHQAAAFMVQIHHSISLSPEPYFDSDDCIIWHLFPAHRVPARPPLLSTRCQLRTNPQSHSPNPPPPGSHSPTNHPWVPLWVSEPERFPKEL